MTRKATAMVIMLALLTLSGFILVSNLMGARRPENNQSRSAAQAKSPDKQHPLSIAPLPPANYKPSQDEGQMHTDLMRAQELLGAISAAMAVNDWANAQQALTEFQGKTQRLPAPQLHHPDISPILQDFFALYAVQLENALAQQNAPQASFAINQLYGIVGEQRARLGTRGVPLEFQRLRFLVREVGLWGEAGDEKMLRLRAAALRDAWWRDVRPIIAARRTGVESAKKFDQLVQQLSAAGQIHEITALLPEFNKGLEQMDTLFQRPRPASGNHTGKTADDEQ